MIVQKFFIWAETAPPETRAEAAAALARSYLIPDMLHFDRRSAELALTMLLDDPSSQVRRALANAFAESPDAPRHVVLALASEPSDVSAPVLARSPLLTDADLVDCAAIGDDRAQTAIARRAHVAREVAAALAEVGGKSAALALLANPGAAAPALALRRIFSRFEADGAVREALLARDETPGDLRLAIGEKTTAALSELIMSRGWLSQERFAWAAREALDRATVRIAAEARATAIGLVTHLRERGLLTITLLLRSLLSGERALFEAALADLSGQPVDRASGLARAWSGGAFAALYVRAGLPRDLLPAFRAALSALDEELRVEEPCAARLRRRLAERTLTACESIETSHIAPVLALFRRLACEAARDEAREQSETWRPGPPQLEGPTERRGDRPHVAIDLQALEAELMAA